MQTKVLTLIVAGLAILPAAAYAKDTQRDATFCAAIGLTQETALTCTQQLSDAASHRQHATLQAAWVSKSPTMDRASAFFASGTDNNTMNGMPDSIYQGKVTHLSNRVTAEINRAVATATKDRAIKVKQLAAAKDSDAKESDARDSNR
jgi:hypothetical protein